MLSGAMLSAAMLSRISSNAAPAPIAGEARTGLPTTWGCCFLPVELNLGSGLYDEAASAFVRDKMSPGMFSGIAVRSAETASESGSGDREDGSNETVEP
jgi:hypothetical protein